MKFTKFIAFCLSAVLLSLSSAGAANSSIGDFALLDHQGKFHQLSWYGDHKAVVLFIQGNNCPIVQQEVAKLKTVRDAFQNKGVAFFMLNPQVADSRDSIAREAEQFSYDFPILVDESQLVAETLGVKRTTQVYVIDPVAKTVLYRGPVAGESGASLTQALESVLSGGEGASEELQTTSARVGCEVSFPARDLHQKNQVSYTNDIVPILQDNCVSCHHEGGIGPWAMSNHAMVQGFSLMMKEVVMTRRMPPGQIDPHVGKAIADVAELTVVEKQKLIHWINAVAVIDDAAQDPLLALTFDNPKFTLGEPDMVFTVPAQTIPASGVIDYRYVPVELNLDKDVWVQAVEFIPGDRQVLHHVIAYLSSPADKSVRGRQNGSARGESIGGFAPGRQPESFRDDSGRIVKAGSNLLLQMHYTTSGRETVDETEIGLYLHDKPPTYIMAGGVAGQRRFLVPPNAKEYKIEGEQLIERDAYLYSMTPHMHFRGKYMSYTAEYPDGSSELILSVPNYSFNWQFDYQLKEPLFLPAGSRIVTNGAMDNSDRNPFNPDPTKPVRFGLQTKHEMFFGFTTLRYVGDTPESLQAEPVADKTDSRDDLAGL